MNLVRTLKRTRGSLVFLDVTSMVGSGMLKTGLAKVVLMRSEMEMRDKVLETGGKATSILYSDKDLG